MPFLQLATRQTRNLFVDPSTRPRRCSDCSRDAPRNQPATMKLLPRVHLQHYHHRRERRFHLESNYSTMLRTAWSSKSSSYNRRRCGSPNDQTPANCSSTQHRLRTRPHRRPREYMDGEGCHRSVAPDLAPSQNLRRPSPYLRIRRLRHRIAGHGVQQ